MCLSAARAVFLVNWPVNPRRCTADGDKGRNVLLLANLKPRNMRGIKSNEMLLAASNPEHTIVQLLMPPDEAVPGERVWFGTEADQSEQAPAATPNQMSVTFRLSWEPSVKYNVGI
ncbi:hypothetical protein R1sor_003992 [Riccia sorocarpa]|uniref:tRNA-binding domain-containing protein n=1 Tax=Riccia sorocarpa TaxID=122646 RepID=A0ABD3H6R2_9MARC